MDLRHRHVPWEVFEDSARWPRPRSSVEASTSEMFRALDMAADMARALRARGAVIAPTIAEREQATRDRAQALDEVTR